MNDLTISAIDRQNVLNNLEAVENIQKYLGISGMLFEIINSLIYEDDYSEELKLRIINAKQI